MKRRALSIHNLAGQKVCDLYDSFITAPGQAYGIKRTFELSGWKELSFTLPYMIDKKTNFRWKYIRNEYRVRVKDGDNEDWFIISTPKKDKSSKAISGTVTCYHCSSVLKTKNLYLFFDDENGIGTCQELMEKVLMNTGWSLGICDTFYEKDGVTEKVRSLASEGKVGAYQLITNICGLFNAYPVYNGATKTVDIHALADKRGMTEMIVGKNMSAMSVSYNTDNLVTRLYVEGEYGDNGYVGIDDVNPTGLTYLLDFGYYVESGLFTDEHQAALDTYLTDITNAVATIKNCAQTQTEVMNNLNELWGQPEYVLYLNMDGEMVEWYSSGTFTAEQKELNPGDEVLAFTANQLYEYVQIPEDGTLPDAQMIIKFKIPGSGIISARESAIEAKETMIENLQKEIEKTFDEVDIAAYQAQIEQLQADINDIYNGTEEARGLYELMEEAISLVFNLKVVTGQLENAQENQLTIEGIFVDAMGDMLRDGYWSNTNYIPGQEEHLYADALEMMKEVSRPQISYSISMIQATDIWGEPIREYHLNSRARVYDAELEVNDILFIDKVTDSLDDPREGAVNISNDDLSITGKTFDSILGRITQLADLIDQKASLYNRAEAISGDGQIQIDRLNGTIDVLRNRLLSTTSSWYTDDEGNIIFQSVNGKSAMMLTGEGFMIANGRTDTGEWNWRTFGTGAGFTADAIITGYLSADRIEANSIGASKLTTDVQNAISQVDSIATRVSEVELQISPESLTSTVMSSTEFQAFVDSVGEGTYVSPEEPESPHQDMLWLDTSTLPPLLKKCEVDSDDGSISWEIAGDTSALSGLVGDLQSRILKAEEKLEDDRIVSTVTSSSLYKDQLRQTKESAVTQTVGELEVRFTVQDEKIDGVNTTVTGIQQNIDTWFRFTSDGLVIGKEGSPFMTKQDNQEYGFYFDGKKVAYMEGSVLNIPQTYARNILRIGGLNGVVDSSGNISWVWIGLDE